MLVALEEVSPHVPGLSWSVGFPAVPDPLKRLRLLPAVCCAWALWGVITWALVSGVPTERATVAALVILADVSFGVGVAVLSAYLVGRVLSALGVGPYSPRDPAGRDWYGS